MSNASESSEAGGVLAPLAKVDAAARRLVADSPVGGYLEFAREKGIDVWMLSIYLGLAPVYWLPIPIIGGEDNRTPLLIVKFLLIAGGVAIALTSDWMRSRFRFPGLLLGPLGFVLLFALSLPGVIQAASARHAVLFALDIVFAALFLWCFFNLTRRGPSVFAVFKRAFIILAALATIAAVVVLASADDLYPHRWDSGFESGFGNKGSGWSIALSLYLPVALMFAITWEGVSARIWALLRGAAVYAVFASQFISGGRAGILTSLVVLAVFAFVRSTRVMLIAVAVALVATTAIFGNASWGRYLGLHFFPADFIAEPFRIERAAATPAPTPTPSPAAATGSGAAGTGAGAAAAAQPSEFERQVDTFSASRVTTLRKGLQGIQDRPFTGYGLRAENLLTDREAWGATKQNIEIHNLWIKWGAYTGLAGPIMMAVILIAIMRVGVRNLSAAWRYARDRMAATAFCLILIVGAIATMFEPNVLVGSFQLTALWWAAAGAALGMWSRSGESGGDGESDEDESGGAA